MGTLQPLPTKGVEPLPNFRPIFIVAKRLDASRCHLVWSPGDCVRWGLSPLPQKGRSPPPNFRPMHVYCGQTAAWIKMPLGTEVGLGQHDIVLDVDPAIPQKKRHTHPTQFLGHVYCGHGRPSQLPLSSCTNGRPITQLS